MSRYIDKCSRCGKGLKHYHWLWNKVNCNYCVVDYNGNTKLYCSDCYTEIEAIEAWNRRVDDGTNRDN